MRESSSRHAPCVNAAAALQKLSIHLSYPLDDSYTPANICVRAGTGPVDIQDLRIVSLDKPDGWVTFDICMEPSEDGEG